MSTSRKLASPGNVYVNLDQALPASLKLKVGQNLVFVRELSCAGEPFLNSLKMPEPFFVTAHDLPYDTRIPGQAPGMYVVGLGLVHSAGTGEILIRFSSSEGGRGRLRRLKFKIAC